jgi:hypothetical protein
MRPFFVPSTYVIAVFVTVCIALSVYAVLDTDPSPYVWVGVGLCVGVVAAETWRHATVYLLRKRTRVFETRADQLFRIHSNFDLKHLSGPLEQAVWTFSVDRSYHDKRIQLHMTTDHQDQHLFATYSFGGGVFRKQVQEYRDDVENISYDLTFPNLEGENLREDERFVGFYFEAAKQTLRVDFSYNGAFPGNASSSFYIGDKYMRAAAAFHDQFLLLDKTISV